MKLFSYTLGLMASAFSPTVAMTANLQPQQEQKDKHPNVILIVADKVKNYYIIFLRIFTKPTT